MKKIYILLFMVLCTLGMSAQEDYSLTVTPGNYTAATSEVKAKKAFSLTNTTKKYRYVIVGAESKFTTQSELMTKLQSASTQTRANVSSTITFTLPNTITDSKPYISFAFVGCDEDGNVVDGTYSYFNYYYKTTDAFKFEVKEKTYEGNGIRSFEVIKGLAFKYYKYKLIFDAESQPNIDLSSYSTELNGLTLQYGDEFSVECSQEGYYTVILAGYNSTPALVTNTKTHFDYIYPDNCFEVKLGDHSVTETDATLDLNVVKGADIAYWKCATGTSLSKAQTALSSAEKQDSNNNTLELEKGNNYVVVAAYNSSDEMVNTTYYDNAINFFTYWSTNWTSLGKKKFTNNLVNSSYLGKLDIETYLVEVDRLNFNDGRKYYRIKNPMIGHSSLGATVKKDRYIYLSLEASGETFTVLKSLLGIDGSNGEYRFANYKTGGIFADNKFTLPSGEPFIYNGQTGTSGITLKNGEFCLDLNDLTKTVDLSHNWGTIGLDYPVEIPAGVVAYKASLDGSVVNLTQFGEEGDVIPANTGAILYAENPKSYDFVATDDADAVTGNALKAAIETYNYTADENVYYLGLDGEKVVFKHLTSGSIAAGKAYLLAPKASDAKLDVVVEGTPTGITEVVPMAVKNDGIYNIQGVRVNNSFKGVVIMNGKKYLKK